MRARFPAGDPACARRGVAPILVGGPGFTRSALGLVLAVGSAWSASFSLLFPLPVLVPRMMPLVFSCFSTLPPVSACTVFLAERHPTAPPGGSAPSHLSILPSASRLPSSSPPVVPSQPVMYMSCVFFCHGCSEVAGRRSHRCPPRYGGGSPLCRQVRWYSVPCRLFSHPWYFCSWSLVLRSSPYQVHLVGFGFPAGLTVAAV